VRPGDRLSFAWKVPGSQFESFAFGLERDADPALSLEAEYAAVAEAVGAQVRAAIEAARKGAGT
jgi:hypothetical protein